jgi:hypothetical protein
MFNHDIHRSCRRMETSDVHQRFVNAPYELIIYAAATKKTTTYVIKLRSLSIQ